MTSLEIWLLFVVIPNIGAVSACIGAGGLVVAGFLLFHAAIEYDTKYLEDKRNQAHRAARRITIASIICIFMAALFPSSKQMAAVLVVPYVTQNQEIQKIPNNLFKKINEVLEVGDE